MWRSVGIIDIISGVHPVQNKNAWGPGLRIMSNSKMVIALNQVQDPVRVPRPRAHEAGPGTVSVKLPEMLAF